MIGFPSTKEIDDTISDFKASLRQAISNLCKLILSGKIDGRVSSAINGINFSAMNEQKFDLS